MLRSLVGSEMCIRDSPYPNRISPCILAYNRAYHGSAPLFDIYNIVDISEGVAGIGTRSHAKLLCRTLFYLERTSAASSSSWTEQCDQHLLLRATLSFHTFRRGPLGFFELFSFLYLLRPCHLSGTRYLEHSTNGAFLGEGFFTTYFDLHGKKAYTPACGGLEWE